MKTEVKRQNFNVTPEQEAEIERFKEAADAPSTKDAILLAVRLANLVASEIRHGKRLFLTDECGHQERLVIAEIEGRSGAGWQYLVERPHAWRRQLFIKGRRLPASVVWSDMLANNMTAEEAADNWDLPVAAVREAVRYCEENRALIEMEAEEEKRRMEAEGASVGA